MVINMEKISRQDGPIAAFAEMRGYWEALRTGDRLPHRADLDPRGLKNCLHQALIAEQIAPGLARMRLAGATFTDIMGMEVRGMPLSALFDPMARAELETVVGQVFNGKLAVTLLLEAERGLGRPALTAQLLLLPMIGDLGEVDLMLGCLVLRGTAGRTPRRFHILHTLREAIGVAPQARPVVPTTFAPAFSEDAQVFQGDPGFQGDTAQTRAPYLRLVK